MDEIFFHGTPFQFDVSDVYPLSHFGTFRAAWMRVGEVLHKRGFRFHPQLSRDGRSGEMPAYVHPVRLAITNPCMISDSKNNFHSCTEIGQMLRRRRIVTAHEEATLRCMDPEAVLIELLKARGYDGLVYENGFEDKGSLSYIALEASQVSSAGPVFETTLKDMLEGRLEDVDVSSLVDSVHPRIV
jgi:hypothetical protein